MKVGALAGVLLWVLATGSAKASFPVNCPDSIEVSQHLQTPVPEWKAGVEDGPYRLQGVTFFDGPPEENASLVNDTMVKSGVGREMATWRFGPGGGRAIWLSCRYSRTSVTMVKSLGNQVKSCSVTYNVRQRVDGVGAIEKIVCY